MGGYFIVNGIEKVIRMLIMQRRNYPIAMSRPKWKSRGQGYTQYGEYDRCCQSLHPTVQARFSLKGSLGFTLFQVFQCAAWRKTTRP